VPHRLLCSAFCVIVASLLLLWGVSAGAEIPHKINYQARLTDTSTGEPLVGSYDLEFRLYDAATAGTLLWSETQAVDIGPQGIVSVILGDETEIDLAFDEPVWLEVMVGGEILTPRREIVSVPYAFYAANSESLGGQSPSDYALTDSLSVTGILNDPQNPVDWTRLKSVPAGFADGVDDGLGDGYSLDASDGNPVDAVYVDEAGHVGVGTTDPQGALHIHSGTSGASPEGGSELVVEDDGNARINLLSPNDTYPGLLFGDPEDNSAGWLIYNHSEDKLRVGVNDADRLTITSDGKVGIGKSSPSEKVDVDGTLKAVASGGAARAVIGEATATGPYGNYGGYFIANADSGKGVCGVAKSTAGAQHYGGYFVAAGEVCRGVYGESSKTGTGGGIGGEFVGRGNEASGVWAEAPATGDHANFGGYFTAAGDQGRAVYGVATSTSDTRTNYGGYFYAHSAHGVGVYSGCSGDDAKAFQAAATGYDGYGVYADASGESGRALYGIVHSNTSGAIAVFGEALGHANSWAGFFHGQVHVAGTLTKTTDEFLIDHPADPENKILRHSVVESPEYLLIYKGRAHLDGGAMTVELPGYFEALVHPDGREIVLTCVNGYTPLYLDGEITDGRFTVRTVDGGVPDQEFSWVVYGTRNDAWAQQNPLVVEEDKTPDGMCPPGRYLNPEAFGIAYQAPTAPPGEAAPPEPREP
jgi:hypothetical protein